MHPVRLLALVTLTLVIALGTTTIRAHCDGLDGPVVKAAQKALDTGDVNFALIWVHGDADVEVRTAFEATRSVRRLSPAAAQLADMHFFETLVRLHRAGEGAPYTGLQPAGRDLGPAIPAADRALESGSIDDLVTLIRTEMEQGLRVQFANVRAKRQYAPDDVSAGREYVAAYVEYVHYVEQLYESATRPVHGHFLHEGLEGKTTAKGTK